jgi:hypothetical protein
LQDTSFIFCGLASRTGGFFFWLLQFGILQETTQQHLANNLLLSDYILQETLAVSCNLLLRYGAKKFSSAQAKSSAAKKIKTQENQSE